MKLVRYDHGGPRVGIVKGDAVVDIAAAGSRFASVRAIAGAVRR